MSSINIEHELFQKKLNLKTINPSTLCSPSNDINPRFFYRYDHLQIPSVFIFFKKIPPNLWMRKEPHKFLLHPSKYESISQGILEKVFSESFFIERGRESWERMNECVNWMKIPRVSSIYTICVWTQIYAENSAKMCYDSNQSYKNEF